MDDATRESVRAKLAEAIDASASDSKDAKEMARAIEAEMNRHFSSLKDYNAKARSLIFNMKQNGELRERIIAGLVTPQHLATCASKDLAPTQLQVKRRESAERYLAQRSLGESSEQVVGWSAGTTGKLEWSHKYEKETMGSLKTADAGGAGTRDSQSLDETGANNEHDMDEDTDDGAYSPSALQDAENGIGNDEDNEEGPAHDTPEFPHLHAREYKAMASCDDSYSPSMPSHGKKRAREESESIVGEPAIEIEDPADQTSAASAERTMAENSDPPSQTVFSNMTFQERVTAPILIAHGLSELIQLSRLQMGAEDTVFASDVTNALDRVRSAQKSLLAVDAV